MFYKVIPGRMDTTNGYFTKKSNKGKYYFADELQSK